MELEEGRIYTLNFTEQVSHQKRRRYKRKMRLVKCYPHHAQFENSKGIRQSFQYWDLYRIMEREESKA